MLRHWDRALEFITSPSLPPSHQPDTGRWTFSHFTEATTKAQKSAAELGDGIRPSDGGARPESGAQLGRGRRAASGRRRHPLHRRAPSPRLCSECARCVATGHCTAGVPAWARARDPSRRSPTPILPPTRPFSRVWWQVSGCRGTARQRRKQDAAEIRLLTCSCDYPGLIKAELPVVSLLPPSASPSPSPLPAAVRALTDCQKPVASGSGPLCSLKLDRVCSTRWG